MKHLHSLKDLPQAELEAILERAESLRGQRTLELIRGKAVVLVFLDPSLRTRASMELAAQELGGRSVTLVPGADAWKLEERAGVVMDADKAEHVKEAAKVLSRFGDLLGVRAFPRGESFVEDAKDPILSAFLEHAEVPVVNLESARYHPCQALADLLTIRRASGDGAPGKVVLTWAPHPKALPVAVPSSFALAIPRMGWDLVLARPEGYDLPDDVLERCREDAARAGGSFEVTSDRSGAFDGARFVYAKSWGRLDRYGDRERELREREALGLSAWRVDDEIMARTDDAHLMHCLPVRRNVVVSDGVLDGPRCLIYEQAENRLHAQKGLLAHLLG